nr:RecName: Full=Palmitoyl-CoA hydrolase; AltName: Full=Long-chain fatty-acyl-CoA hydrolase [Rattus norvegicus]
NPSSPPVVDTTNTTSYPPMCSQDAVGGQVLENIPLQEDCLYNFNTVPYIVGIIPEDIIPVAIEK